MSAQERIDAVMLVGFGAPTRPEQIRPFLDNLLRGRPVPKERYEEVVRHYEAVGGGSPYNDLTNRQAKALRERLTRDGVEIPVAVGMRNWEPYVLDAMRELQRAGARRILGFVLAAHRCEASWERYQETVRAAQEQLGTDAPEVVYPQPWHAHPKFIEAVASRTRDALARLSSKDAARAHLLFTAHSIPVAMAQKSGYVDEVRESARLVAKALSREKWSLAFQSRSGSPREQWLEPDITPALRALGGNAVVIIPIGFLCDHLEVLYDLDVDARKIAEDAEIAIQRAGTVGDHPAFIEMIASFVASHRGA